MQENAKKCAFLQENARVAGCRQRIAFSVQRIGDTKLFDVNWGFGYYMVGNANNMVQAPPY